MNVHAPASEAKRAQSEGNIIYARLLPRLKKQGIKSGAFVAINIESGGFVIAETRVELMQSYKEKFGRSAGWVRRIE